MLDEIIDEGAQRPERVYIFLLDGQSNTELKYRLQNDADAIPNLRRLIRNGTMFEYGSFTNFPSITWPSHNAIGTGAWGGHHDIVNPTYYLRETRETVTPQGQQFDTAKFLGDGVETLYEAFHRVFGAVAGAARARSPHRSTSRARAAPTTRRSSAASSATATACARSPRATPATRTRSGSRTSQKGAHARVDRREPRPGAGDRAVHRRDAPAAEVHVPRVAADRRRRPRLRTALRRPARRARRERTCASAASSTMLEAQGLLDDTLFIITTDHGMAPTDASLKANQVRAVTDAGMKAIIPDPLIYLHRHGGDGARRTRTAARRWSKCWRTTPTRRASGRRSRARR